MSGWLDRQFGLTGRTALVTGARTGIGRDAALALAEAGADLVLWGREETGLAEVAAQARARGVRVETMGVDMSDLDAVRQAARQVATTTVDILVNNAGTIRRAPVVDTTTEQWRQVMTVNLDAVFELTRTLATPMIARGLGTVVNIASLLSFQGGLNVSAYTASKHAIAGLTRAMANEWAARGINVNAVAPGYIETSNTEALRADPVRSSQILARIPAGRWGRPDDVAGGVVFLCSPAARYIHGHVLVIDGGWMSW
ncbi:MAG: SDR family oxidoreductase [Actinomycetes bacterium]